MERVFTREEVLRLASDASSAKSGQELAQARKWVTIGGDVGAIWGECHGSGAKPYQVQIELTEPAFKCSCPSRKFPCKHGLGLLLIFATTPESVAKADRPAWVNEWLASREARAAKAAEKQSRGPQAPDPAEQAKRREKRIDRARRGLAELSAWLLDLVRNGIAAVPGKGFEFFDSQARRMIDAQAPGVARRVRLLGSVAGGGAGWQRPFLEQMAILHLLTRATERLDELPEAVRADVEAALGITTSADELSGLPVTADRWQVIAQEVEVEDRLRIQRTWFYGVGSRRSAMVLQFAHGAATFDANLPVGRQFDGELVFFPGNGPRASVHRIGGSPEPLSSVNGCDSVEDLLGRFSHALAACPWIERLCWPLCRVIPSKIDEQWWLIDATDAALPMRLRDDVGFTLLAESGGRPVDIAAEYDGESLRPLSVVVDGRFLSLAAAMAEAA